MPTPGPATTGSATPGSPAPSSTPSSSWTSARLSDLLGAFFGDDLFGGGRRARPAGGDVAAAVEISFAEAAFGVTREVAVDVDRRLRALRRQRRGARDGAGARARRAAAPGRVQRVAADGARPVRPDSPPAPPAAAAASRSTTPCSECRGPGPAARCAATVEVQVPAGIMDGQRIHLRGRGGDAEPGGEPGDLYVRRARGRRPAVRARRQRRRLGARRARSPRPRWARRLTVETLDGEERGRAAARHAARAR